MPYVPPHLRTPDFYEDKKVGPRIATSLSEAAEMSSGVLKDSKKDVLVSMLTAPVPKKAIAAAKRDKRTNPSPTKKSIAAGSFGSLIEKREEAVKKTDVSKVVVLHKSESEFDAAMDEILRVLFEDHMKNVKRAPNAGSLDFSRRTGGSYKNERLESRYQGFKLQKLEDVSGGVDKYLEDAIRIRFEMAMDKVKRISTAQDDFSRRENGSYWNERLESRFQGYLLGVMNDFGLIVLKKTADLRVERMKAERS